MNRIINYIKRILPPYTRTGRQTSHSGALSPSDGRSGLTEEEYSTLGAGAMDEATYANLRQYLEDAGFHRMEEPKPLPRFKLGQLEQMSDEEFDEVFDETMKREAEKNEQRRHQKRDSKA